MLISPKKSCGPRVTPVLVAYRHVDHTLQDHEQDVVAAPFGDHYGPSRDADLIHLISQEL
jgi:hypothetical protein